MSRSTAELNATPLIDVFLVLLVMLIVTIPIATHAIKIELPLGKPAAHPVQTVNVDIDFDGRVFWNGMYVANESELSRRFAEASRAEPVPIVKVWPEARARYERVAQVLAAAQRAHVAKLSVSPIP